MATIVISCYLFVNFMLWIACLPESGSLRTFVRMMLVASFGMVISPVRYWMIS